MLELEIPATEQWDEKNQEFVYSEKQTLCLEHSLISLSKWESKWHKPYLSSRNLTKEEAIDYVRCMTINKVKDDRVYYLITPKMFEKINDYISDPMSGLFKHIKCATVKFDLLLNFGSWCHSLGGIHPLLAINIAIVN